VTSFLPIEIHVLVLLSILSDDDTDDDSQIPAIDDDIVMLCFNPGLQNEKKNLTEQMMIN